MGTPTDSSVIWNGQTFNIGAASTYNGLQATGQTVALTQGYYTSIMLLGTATGGAYQPGSFKVNYVGGGSSTFSRTMSDWQNGYDGGGTTAPDESLVATMISYNSSSSGNMRGFAYLYGYVLPVSPGQLVSSITLPNNVHIVVIAIDEVDQPAQVNLGDIANSVNPPTTISALSFNGITGLPSGGFNGINSANESYSATNLATVMGSASTPTWNSQTFNLGPTLYGDAIASNSQVITLPPGSFTSIEILGTAVGGHPQSGTFTVNYSSGSPTQITQTFSDWQYGYNGTGGTTAPGESIAATMNTYNTPTGNVGGTRYLYGYVISINSSKTVSSIVLPSNTDMIILAIDEVNQSALYSPNALPIRRLPTPVLSGRGGSAGQVTVREASASSTAIKSIKDLVASAIENLISAPEPPAVASSLLTKLDPSISEFIRGTASPTGTPTSSSIVFGSIEMPLIPVADSKPTKNPTKLSLSETEL